MAPVDNGNRIKEQRELIKGYLRQKLGEDYFLLCEVFFASVWDSCAPYKVFLARRCLNLMYMYYLCADDERKSEDLESSFFSDNALLSSAPEIAEAYRNTGMIPKILLVDEILVHGRSFNHLISELIERIYTSLLDMRIEVDKTRLEQDVLFSIRIRVIFQSNNSLLLFGSYYKTLKAEKICSTKEWHQFSSAVCQAIAGGVVANTSFVPSLQLRMFDSEEGNKLYRHLSEKADLYAHPFPYQNKFLEKAWVYPLTSPDGAVRAVYTLRVIPGEMDGNPVIVPFVFFSGVKIRREGLRQILMRKFFARLDSEGLVNAEKAFRYWTEDAPVWMEMLTFLLSQNFLLLLLQGGEVEGWDAGMDYEKIRMSFRSRKNSDTKQLFHAIVKRKTPWMTFEQMNELLLTLTSDTKPLFDMGAGTDIHAVRTEEQMAESIRQVEDAIGDLLSEHGLESEYHAYRQSVGEEFRTGFSIPDRTIAEILQDLDHRIGRQVSGEMSRENFFCCAVVLLLRYMDIGVAAAVPSYNGLIDEENEEYCYMCRTGESSQAVLPQRNFIFLPILAIMEQDSLRNSNRLMHQMGKFFPPVVGVQKTEKLITFVDRLYRTGQWLRDWAIDFSGWIKWMWKKSQGDEHLTPTEIRKRDMKYFVSKLGTQTDLFNKYLAFRKE